VRIGRLGGLAASAAAAVPFAYLWVQMMASSDDPLTAQERLGGAHLDGTWPSIPRPTGRSLRSGLAAAAWATALGGLLVVVAWLAEAPRWYRQIGGLLLDADGGIGMGANLGDAIWWTLIVLALWALPLGVLGAAAGSARARRRRSREHAELV
jgi:hypothetical protein